MNFLVQRLRIWKILALLTIILTFLTLCGFMGKLWWFFDMASHFRMQYFANLALLAFLFFVGKKFSQATFAGTFALVNLSLVMPPITGNSNPILVEQSLRALTINLGINNSSFDKARNLIKKTQPDILLLMEYLPPWEKELQETLGQYRFSKVSSLKNGWALGFFSRIPIEESSIIYLGNVPIPIVKAKLKIGEKLVNFIGAHLQDPSSPTRQGIRNKQLHALSQYLQEKTRPVMVLGDLNVSPWSPYFTDLTKKNALHGTKRNEFWLPTWPTYFPLLQIPLDYFLASEDIVISKYERGPDIGSDHYPVVVDFSLMPQKTSPSS